MTHECSACGDAGCTGRCRAARDVTTDYADGYRAGAKDMREAAAQRAERAGFHDVAHDIRALPAPAPREEPDGLSYRGG